MSWTAPLTFNRRVVIEKTMHIIECANCQVDFGIGDDFMARRREDHGTFYCPNGHSNVYRQDNEKERLAKELAAAKTRERLAKELAAAKTRERLASDSERFYRAQAAASQRSAAAVRGHLTRLRNRISAGVCPCCNRSFENVRRHIEGQHPDWATDHAAALSGA